MEAGVDWRGPELSLPVDASGQETLLAADEAHVADAVVARVMDGVAGEEGAVAEDAPLILCEVVLVGRNLRKEEEEEREQHGECLHFCHFLNGSSSIFFAKPKGRFFTFICCQVRNESLKIAKNVAFAGYFQGA